MKLVTFLILIFQVFRIFAIDPAIICHGGAGAVEQERYNGKFRGTILAVQIGYKILQDGGNVMDAVEEAIKSLELDDNYNAGYGSVLTSEGDVEMDACIMDGKTMKVGAVTGVKNIYHPITLSRRVMEKTRYNFLGAEGAMNLAHEEGFPIQKPGSLISPRSLASWNEWKNQQNMTLQQMTGEGGTVGCVAIDINGNIVAGTSTGGLTGKMPSRIGDTPIVGSGTYADNNIGGISATGTGEVIMKSVLAFDILKRVQYIPGKSLQQHAQESCDEMEAFYEDDGGVVGLDKNGNMAAAFSSDQMSWAFQNNAQNIKYGINPNETFEYDIEACKNRNCVLGV